MENWNRNSMYCTNRKLCRGHKRNMLEATQALKLRNIRLKPALHYLPETTYRGYSWRWRWEPADVQATCRWKGPQAEDRWRSWGSPRSEAHHLHSSPLETLRDEVVFHGNCLLPKQAILILSKAKRKHLEFVTCQNGMLISGTHSLKI